MSNEVSHKMQFLQWVDAIRLSIKYMKRKDVHGDSRWKRTRMGRQALTWDRSRVLEHAHNNGELDYEGLFDSGKTVREVLDIIDANWFKWWSELNRTSMDIHEVSDRQKARSFEPILSLRKEV